MSEALTVLNNNALVLGGAGLDFTSKIFKLKPATVELVQKTTRQEGAQPGKFRVTATNEHFETMRVVLLSQPTEQREYYLKGNEFSKDSKLCFSLDNVQPHTRAKEPQGLTCATCPKGDVNWKKWYKTHDANDLPPCRKYWHCVFADRGSQLIYFFNAKGTSVTPFEQSMQNLARLFAALAANVTMHNRKLAEGEAPLPLPNIFDIAFTLYPYQKEKGGPWIVGCKDFAQLKPEDRSSFGALFLEFQERQKAGQVVDQVASEAEEATEAVNGPAPAQSAPAIPENQAVVGNVTGEVLPPDASKITI